MLTSAVFVFVLFEVNSLAPISLFLKSTFKASIISTDEMGLEKPTAFNFRAGSLSSMDVPSAILSSMKYVEEHDNPDIIFIEGQSKFCSVKINNYKTYAFKG